VKTNGPSELETEIRQSKTLKPGQEHYRAYVGPPGQYDFMGATQFSLLFHLGLREEHTLLDVGCGSMRCGRYAIQYLLPDRYHGIEPNTWLWQSAFEKEIGSDLIDLKRPVFSTNADFEFGHFLTSFDFIVAQSIFSHTGRDLLTKALGSAAKTLEDKGQFLFTVLDETTPHFDHLADLSTKSGWIYPKCVVIRRSEIEAMCEQAGLHVQALPWFHPRQRWYRAVSDADLLLSSAQFTQLGTGRPLFDSRF
jgi:cyclopropane fatty-acyl-phospholipid synthase-like methyltransferase